MSTTCPARPPLPPAFIAKLDQGIRETVAWLHQRGFDIVTANDGSGGRRRRILMPLRLGLLLHGPRLLRDWLMQLGVHVGPGMIEMTYDPATDAAQLALHDVDDAVLAGAAGWNGGTR